jgi:hypothetical protein
MKRKFLAAALVLAMVMSMSAIATAEEPTEPKLPPNQGEAGIAYKEGSIDIIDPDDPDVPGGNDWSFATTRDIDFGLHDLSQNLVEQKYASWMEHRFADTDYVGVNIRNGSLDRLTITVEIGEFSVAQGEGQPRIPTLKGFVLRLVKEGFITKVEGDDKNVTNPNTKPIGNPDKATAVSSNAAGFNKADDHKEGTIYAGQGSKAPILHLPELSVSAASWGGILTVPQNTVERLGEAQAVMTWNFDRIPPVTTP